MVKETIPLLIAVVLGLFVYALATPEWTALWIVNIALSLTLMMSLGVGAVSQLRANRAHLFTAAFWWRVATSVYFGLGNIAPYLVGDAAEVLIRASFDFTDFELLKFNIVVLVGVLSILQILAVFSKPIHRLISAFPQLQKEGSRTELVTMAFLFITFGIAIRYGVFLPNAMGLSDFVLPGSIQRLGVAFYAGLFLLVLFSLRSGGRLAVLTIALILFDLVISVTTFAKVQVMLLGIFVSLAFLWHRFTLKRVAVTAATLLILFVALIPVIDFGRAQMFSRFGSLSGGTVELRLQYVQDYFQYAENRTTAEIGALERALSRLSYVNVSTFVVDRYDRGLAGETYAAAAVVLIPRVFWPDKPSISDQSIRLAILFQGISTTSTGSGVFSEAYWNFGWMGVLIGMSFYGLLLCILSQVALIIMQREQWIFLPVVLASVQFGTRVDGTMTVDVIGPFAIMVVLFFALYFLTPIFNSLPRSAARSAKMGKRSWR